MDSVSTPIDNGNVQFAITVYGRMLYMVS